MKTIEQIKSIAWAKINELENCDPDNRTLIARLSAQLSTLADVLDDDIPQHMADHLDALFIAY